MLTFRFGSTTLAWLNVLRVELSSDESNVNGPGIKTAMIGLLGSLNTSKPSAPRRGARLRQLSSIEKERIRTWADELDPRSRPSLRDLANIVEMSPDYCARLFRQSFGQSFETWIIAARMRSAAFRIGESTLPISAISEEYGFSTPYFFSRQFKQIMGCSPRAYRLDQAF
jgi:AraC-like DNA-binding protein